MKKNRKKKAWKKDPSNFFLPPNVVLVGVVVQDPSSKLAKELNSLEPCTVHPGMTFMS